ncbi:MAG TPA: ABC transporter permease [Cyclobacteriaceae bacterium]|jgi:ABC-type antimicrobial peptide transport system permease subunit|nr:ABC transporter permease [Cyclobacteriaceae bacterium]
MFDLEKEIQQWLRSFHKHRAFDHGSVREMEQHLRDHIEDLIAKGNSADEAFKKATIEFGDIAPIANEEFTNLKRKKTLATVVHSATLPMNKFSFTIAMRNILRRPLFSFIKIAGLSVGVSGCVIVFLMTSLELSFDKFHPDGDKIHRVISTFSGVWEGSNPAVPLPLPDALRDRVHGVEAVSQMLTDNLNVEVPEGGSNKKFVKPNLTAYVDHHYFEVFQAYRWVIGTPKVLDAPNVVAITESKAKTYFGETDLSKVIGKRLIYRDSLEANVVGIIADQRERTDFNFTDFISLSTLKTARWKDNYNFEEWGDINSAWQCFIRLSNGTAVSSIDELLKAMSKESDAKSDVKGPPRTTFTLFKTQPLGDIHFNNKLGTWDDGRPVASLPMIEALAAIAALLLVIAVINFVNLETAQALRRAREVGLRKVMGGTRAGLLLHFISEGFLITSIAVLLSIPLSKLAITAFSEFLPSELTLSFSDVKFVLFLIGLLVIIPLLSGTYPALALSSFQPVDALRMKGTMSGSSSAFLRKTLTVVQFSFSQALIAAALIVSLQISWMINKDLGFTREAIVTMETPYWDKVSKRVAFRHELEQLSAVAAINQSSRPPTFHGSNTTTLHYYNDKKEDLPTSVHFNAGDTSYVSLFGLKLVAGRNVTPVDSLGEILVNEAYCAKLNIAPIDMIGKDVKRGSGKKYVVAGVLKDFHHASLHSVIQPWFFEYESNYFLFSLKLANTTNTPDAIDQIKKAWSKIYPDMPPNISFLDDTVRKFYEAERRVAVLANTATALAIFISCLGLFGLASFTAIQRTKEIGIRKVLGASVNGIMALLSREFLLLIGLSFLFAVPIAWYAGRQWLSGFAYSMPLSVWIFLMAGALSIVIALLTVGFQAIKAAIRNPVESLRYE